MDEELTWSLEESDVAVTLVVRGALTRRTGNAFDAALRKVLLDRGRLVVDVSGMRVLWRPALAVFGAALASAGGWPLARLAIVDTTGAVAEQLRATRGSDGVVVATDRAAGRVAVDCRPSRVRRASELPSDTTAPAYARVLVRAACAEWGVDEDVDRSVAVANELVTNAAQHGGGRLVLHLSQDRRGLTIGVRDGSGWARVPAEPEDDPECRQFGLRLVRDLSDSWGVTRHGDGKTVWALLRTGAAEGHVQ